MVNLEFFAFQPRICFLIQAMEGRFERDQQEKISFNTGMCFYLVTLCCSVKSTFAKISNDSIQNRLIWERGMKERMKRMQGL